ncbi:MAG: M13 family metallopeptidase [Myxococcaceae bacterium]|nr:M13 family metallopeptidase [Myxococcaceae bacterium]MCI0670228.1 M13 family metallopeptidase [Myxococcaceae bacterium]
MSTFQYCTVIALAAVAAGCGETNAGEELATSVDVTALDRSVAPCEDFYAFACGGWVKKHPLPDDASVDARFFEPFYAEARILSQIIEDNLNGIHRADDPEGALVANFYTSCMDAPGASTAARAQLQTLLQPVNDVTSTQDLPRAVARLRELGAPVLFSFYVDVDPVDSRRRLATMDQGGFSLPDREYYVNPEHAPTLERYRSHILTLSQELAPGATVDPDAVLRIETALARASLDRATWSDPIVTYNRTTRADFLASVPEFGWEDFWFEAGVGGFTELNVTVPSFFDALGTLLAEEPLEDVKSYLRWQLIETLAGFTHQAVLDEEFDFHARLFYGQQEAQPRWWTCYLDTVDRMGHALARPYVARHFGEESRSKAQDVLRKVRSAFRKRLEGSAWLDVSTRTEAFAKLDEVNESIGYPDTWKSYAGLGIGPGSYLDNQNRLTRDAYRSNSASLEAPVGQGLWAMPPIEVNAYYSPAGNRMVFPAGILQLPFFALSASPASNFGGIGTVMGHELTHGFDDQGRHFDGTGRLRDWWTAPVEERFLTRTQCLVDQYSDYQPLPGEHIDGELTLGENIADLGGLRVSYEAFRAMAEAEGEAQSTLADFDAKQEFFLAFAQIWCENRRPDLLRVDLLTDPHSPAKFRVNGTLSNLPAFADAFQCSAGDKMLRAETCEVW